MGGRLAMDPERRMQRRRMSALPRKCTHSGWRGIRLRVRDGWLRQWARSEMLLHGMPPGR